MLNIDQLKYDFKKSKEEYFLNVIDGLESNQLEDHKMIHWSKNDTVYFTRDIHFKTIYIESDTFQFYKKIYNMLTSDIEYFLKHMLCKHCIITNDYYVHEL